MAETDLNSKSIDELRAFVKDRISALEQTNGIRDALVETVQNPGASISASPLPTTIEEAEKRIELSRAKLYDALVKQSVQDAKTAMFMLEERDRRSDFGRLNPEDIPLEHRRPNFRRPQNFRGRNNQRDQRNQRNQRQ